MRITGITATEINKRDTINKMETLICSVIYLRTGNKLGLIFQARNVLSFVTCSLWGWDGMSFGMMIVLFIFALPSKRRLLGGHMHTHNVDKVIN